MGLHQRGVLKGRGLVGELMRRKGWGMLRGMLRLHRKGILVCEGMAPESVRVEAMDLIRCGGLTSVQASFRGWQR